MEILINIQHPDPNIAEETIKLKARAILSALTCDQGELSLVLVDDATIARYNQQYLGRSGPTNVIAFPMQDGTFTHIHPELLGDVMISLDTCEKEARLAQITVERRFDQLLIHGILHLFGYDHVDGAEQALEMDRKSRELIQIISRLE